jgi:hypothetical protein
MSYFDKASTPEPAPRSLRAQYSAEGLMAALGVLMWLALVAAVVGAIVGGMSVAEGHKATSDVTVLFAHPEVAARGDLAVAQGWATLIWSVAVGAAAAVSFAFFRAVLALLAEIRQTAIWSHNLQGEQLGTPPQAAPAAARPEQAAGATPQPLARKRFWDGRWRAVLDDGSIGPPCEPPTDAERQAWGLSP